MKSHGNEIANKFSFYDIITLNVSANETAAVGKEMQALRYRCLDPGLYYKHMRNWLAHFSPRQFLILDGDLLKTRPHVILHRVQTFVGTQKILDYSKRLRFDVKKRFYCLFVRKNNASRVRSKTCLGSSKGRNYTRIDQRSKNFLNRFFNESNLKFLKLLTFFKHPIPDWLTKNSTL
jgi:hypothetical protein